MGKVVRLHAVKERVESRGFIPPILSLGSTWRSVVNFTPWEKALRTHLLGGYVDPERGCTFRRREKLLVPAQNCQQNSSFILL